MKLKYSTVIPLLLLIYLGIMSYIGLPEYHQGHYFYYFGVIGVTLVIIVILHFYLKKRELIKAERNHRRNSES